MIELFWRLVARIVCTEAVFNWLVRRAVRRPYRHIMSPDGSRPYMLRYWLFNPYDEASHSKRFSFLPSIRLHNICVEDGDRHLHDHPWNARTIILRGGYLEEREPMPGYDHSFCGRQRGDTTRLRFGEYHRIHTIWHHNGDRGGCWTLFITWRYRGTWGFKVDGRKVPWREYLNIK